MIGNLAKHPNGNNVTNNNYSGKPITETIVNGFFTVDNKWTIKYWNRSAEKLLGVLAKDVIGKNLWEKFVDIIPVNFYAVYHKAFIEDVPFHFKEYWAEKGAWFDVITYFCEDTLSVSFKSSSQPAQQENQLKVLNQLYKFVTEVTNDCLWELDLETKELFWIDGGHKRVFGYQIENAIIPQNFWECRIHPADKQKVLNKLHSALASKTETLWEDDYRFQRADGTFAYVHDRGHIIYNSEGKACRMVGATEDVTSEKLTETRLLETERNLVHEKLSHQKEITNAVLTAQENERADIGKEMHDNLNQILGAAKLYIELAKTDDVNRQTFLDKSSGLILNVMDEIRRICKTMTPPVMLMGLLESIRSLIEDLLPGHKVKIEFYEKNIDEDSIDQKLQLNIFRIVQEQLNNILKHAKATQAIINLSRQENQLTLVISDNGQGCDILEKKKGVGILNIKSRAELYHGRVTVTSAPGEGYELKVILRMDSINGTTKSD